MTAWLCQDSNRIPSAQLLLTNTYIPFPTLNTPAAPRELSEEGSQGDLPSLTPEDHFNPVLPATLSFSHYLSNKHNATIDKNLKNEKTEYLATRNCFLFYFRLCRYAYIYIKFITIICIFSSCFLHLKFYQKCSCPST